MRHRKCRGLGDSGMSRQRLINFDRRDFFSAPIDQIVLTTVKREEAIPINATDIPSSEPPVDKGLAIKLRGIEIA